MASTGSKKRPSTSTSISSKSKKTKYANVYKSVYQEKFPWIKKSNISANHAFCRYCIKDFSIASGGAYDLAEHQSTASHQKASSSASTSKGIGAFFVSEKDSDAVRSMETEFAYFFAEHNIPFAAADHLSKMMKKFMAKAGKDPELATKFTCSRTKTTRLVKDAIAPVLDEAVVRMCVDQPFSILIDESNDSGGDKVLVILVRLFDSDIGEAVTRILDIPVCNISTAEAIFTKITGSLGRISLGNLVSFTSDNCNTMMGKNNSVMTRMMSAQPGVYINGCVCHLANLCAASAVKALPVPVEDLLVDVFYHFQHSTKRREEYKEYMAFCDVEPCINQMAES